MAKINHEIATLSLALSHADLSHYLIHPALLDGALQGALVNVTPGILALPMGIEKFQIYTVSDSLPAYAYHCQKSSALHDIYLLNKNGDVLASIQGLMTTLMPRSKLQRLLSQLSGKITETGYYAIKWETSPFLEKTQEKPSIEKCLYLLPTKASAESLLAQLPQVECAILLPSEDYYVNVNTQRWIKASLSDVLAERWSKIIYGWALQEHIELTWNPSEYQQMMEALLWFVQTLAKASHHCNLYLLTQGAQSTSPVDRVNLSHVSFNGFCKTLQIEYPYWSISHVDLDISLTYLQQLPKVLHEFHLNPEQQDLDVCYRGLQRFVSRACRLEDQQSSLLLLPETNYQLTKDASGNMAAMQLMPQLSQALLPDEVRVAVHAVGVNFRDVLNAMNLYPNGSTRLGSDFSGKILEIGTAVHSIKVGDDVIGMGIGSLGSYVVAHQALVFAKPRTLTHAQAATLPTVFLTNYRALIEEAQLKQGDKILIHAATGGIGLSAIQMAQQIGAKIYATAGTKTKRDYLYQLGVQHVYDSRSLNYATDILSDTQQQGVNVILNSLTGKDFIAATLRCCAQNARFIELSKRDIWTAAQIAEIRSDIDYRIVALDVDMTQHPDKMPAMWAALQPYFEQGIYNALPVTAFSIRQSIDAFYYMQQAKHIGKVVITLQKPQQEILSLSSQASYLITGGLSGLGFATAELWVQRGAKQLILVARRSPDAKTEEKLMTWRKRGVDIRIIQADISDEVQVQQLLHTIQAECLPLKGIIHSAGLLMDAPLTRQDWQHMEYVFKPKVYGAWYLHNWTQKLHFELDYFVMYSSIASFLGNVGQANHASANAFLDGLVHYRQAQGLAGQTIHWGPWADIGTAASYKKLHENIGLKQLRVAEGLEAIEWMSINPNVREIAVFSANWPQLAGMHKKTERFLEAVIVKSLPSVKDSSDYVWVKSLYHLLGESRQAAIEAKLKNLVAQISGVELSEIKKEMNFTEIGLDSLMMVELSNRVQSLFKNTISFHSQALIEYPSIKALSHYIIKQLEPLAKSAISVAPSLSEKPKIDNYLAPRSAIEKKLVTLFEEKLQIKKIGIYDEIKLTEKITLSQWLIVYRYLCDEIGKIATESMQDRLSQNNHEQQKLDVNLVLQKANIATMALYISCFVEWHSEIGQETLFTCVKKNNPIMVSVVQAKGKRDINMSDMHGKTCLHLVVQLRNVVMAQWLVSQGANINQRTTLGITPLALAVFNQHVAMIKVFLEYSPEIDQEAIVLSENEEVKNLMTIGLFKKSNSTNNNLLPMAVTNTITL